MERIKLISKLLPRSKSKLKRKPRQKLNRKPKLKRLPVPRKREKELLQPLIPKF
jgi:hypothetical protein